jgi:heme/copper-type cytochrome/quinol oxidase subunit 4
MDELNDSTNAQDKPQKPRKEDLNLDFDFDFGIVSFALSIGIVLLAIKMAMTGSLGLYGIAAVAVLAVLCSVLGLIVLAIVYVRQKKLSNWAIAGLIICCIIVLLAFSVR